MKLVIGLGNPGAQYIGTRHNAGFVAADKIAQRLGVDFTRTLEEARVARAHHAGTSVMLVKPQTFMNLSGRSAAAIARRYGCSPEDMLVLVDDRHLPLGNLRFRSGGGAGGHKGLLSITAEFGTTEFHRLRLGIGSEAVPRGNMSAFVLGKFLPEEQPVVNLMTDRAAEASLCWLEQGIGQAMNRFNARDSQEGV